MPNIESMIYTGKAEKKVLRLSFSEGDDVVSCIKQAMTENNLTECKVAEVSGRLKFATVSCFEGNKYKKVELKNKEIIGVSGIFKFSGGDLWGNMRVLTAGANSINGTLISGKAAEGFELGLSFTVYPK
jgi:predicted DNA-binding protein with PD1-like motif